MARSELIYDYLSHLEIYLSRVSEAQAKEVVQEIESHIFDSLSLHEGPEAEAVTTILGRLGTPRELAAGYIEHLTIGTQPPKGLKRLSNVKRHIGKGMYYLICALGYFSGILSVFAALAKLVSPDSFNVWIAEHGNSIVLSFSQTSYEAEKLPALWFIPCAGLFGILVVYLTSRIARVLQMHL